MCLPHSDDLGALWEALRTKDGLVHERLGGPEVGSWKGARRMSTKEPIIDRTMTGGSYHSMAFPLYSEA